MYINKAVFCLEQAWVVTMNRFYLKQGQCLKESEAQHSTQTFLEYPSQANKPQSHKLLNCCL